jgi:hypothetical protein
MLAFVVALALLVIGLFWTLTEIHRIRQATASLQWPRVQGRVLAAGVHVGTVPHGGPLPNLRDETADITYEYKVAGRTYQSRQLDFTGIFGAGHDRIATALVRYEPGHTVTVRYDPRNPANAVLTSEIDWRIFVRIAIALAMAGGGIWLLRA